MKRLRSLHAFLGYLLAAGGLLWVLHDVSLAELLHEAHGIDWKWISLALAFDVLSYVAQGWRWRLLLEPLGDISVLQTTQAIYAGLFTNEVLPMRAGEVVRAWIVARRLGVRISAAVASILVERVLDAAWLAAAVGVTAMAVPLPHNLTRAADLLGAAALALTAAFVFLILKKPGPAARESHGGRVLRTLAALRDGLRSIGLSRRLYLSAVASLVVLAAQILAFWFVMWGGGLRLSFWVGAAVLIIVHLGTAIPNAPANVGSYQFFCVLGLSFFGVPKAQAAAFSFVVFLLLTMPLWLLGFVAVSTTGMTVGRLRSAASGKAASSDRIMAPLSPLRSLRSPQ